MLSFVLLILALRRYINFHIFAGGPLTFLVNSGVIETRYAPKKQSAVLFLSLNPSNSFLDFPGLLIRIDFNPDPDIFMGTAF
jgi:hypothetical protein